MNCAEINLLLHAYVDGELDVMRSLDVEQHIKGCSTCAAKLNSLKSLQSALKDSELVYRAPASLRAKVQRMTQTPAAEAGVRPFDLQWLWKWLAVGATAVAVVAILLRPAQTLPNDQMLGEVVACHIRSLMPGHLTDVLSSDQHTVKPWFAGKLDFSPDVKDFAAQDFPLIGGRLDYVNGRTVAALVYQHKKHLINVFIWPIANASGSEEETSYHGYNVINREANGFHYCVVSDMDEKGLEQLAGLLGE
jgi:anti-sigma factor RsiW